MSFGPPEAGEWWKLQEVSISSNSAATGLLTAYLGGVQNATADPNDFHSRTVAGIADTWSDGGCDTFIHENELFTLVWSGMTPGSQCFTKVSYLRLAIGFEPSQLSTSS